MGIGHDGLKAEAERDSHNEAVEALRQLMLWHDIMGGFEASVWNRARAVLARVDAAVTETAPENPGPPLQMTCPVCHETSSPGEVDTTWQQWQCACCGSWNVSPEAR